MARIEAEALPATTRALAELLAARVSPDVQTTKRIELELQGGRLVALWRHDRFGATELGRFDAEAADELVRELLERVQAYSS